MRLSIKSIEIVHHCWLRKTHGNASCNVNRINVWNGKQIKILIVSKSIDLKTRPVDQVVGFLFLKSVHKLAKYNIFCFPRRTTAILTGNSCDLWSRTYRQVGRCFSFFVQMLRARVTPFSESFFRTHPQPPPHECTILTFCMLESGKNQKKKKTKKIQSADTRSTWRATTKQYRGPGTALPTTPRNNKTGPRSHGTRRDARMQQRPARAYARSRLKRRARPETRCAGVRLLQPFSSSTLLRPISAAAVTAADPTARDYEYWHA